MKIAVSCQNGEVFQDLGNASDFCVFTAEGGKVSDKESIKAEGVSGEGIVAFLKEKGVEQLVCGEVDEKILQAAEQAGIKIHAGATGNAEEAVRAIVGNAEEKTEESAAEEKVEEPVVEEAKEEPVVEEVKEEPVKEVKAEPAPVVKKETTPGVYTQIVELSENNFAEEVSDHDGYVLIDFYADWCQPCKAMAPVFEGLNKEVPQIKFCRVDVSAQPQLAAVFGVTRIPTLALVNARETVAGMVGVQSKEDVLAMLKEVL